MQVVAPFKLGVGTVCEQGLPAGKEVATGFEMYAMVKVRSTATFKRLH